MGNLIWHDWARFVTIAASIYAIWAGYWAIFYRKFFWDFVGGNVRDPGGVQAPNSANLFVTLIIKAPVIPIFAMILGAGLLALEWPLPYVKNWSLRRSFVVRIVALLAQAFLGFLYYQGTNSAIYSLVGVFGYVRAQMLGEVMEEAKANRGRPEKA